MQVDLLGAALGRQLGHGDQMILVAVHATVGKQAEDVHRLTRTYGLVDGGTDGRIGEELAVADRLGHPGEVLVHHAAGAEIHVADLGVAHLPVRQADIHATAGDQSVRLSSQQTIVNRLARGMDGIEVRAVAVPEAIENDQYQRFGRGGGGDGHAFGLLARGRKRAASLLAGRGEVTNHQGSAGRRGCVYWPAFYRPGTR